MASRRKRMRRGLRALRSRVRAPLDERRVRADAEWLAGERNPPVEADVPLVTCVVRDGEPHLEAFLAHYRTLGCRRFVLLDNGSSDATLEMAADQPDVTLLRSRLPFRRFGLALKRHLVHRYGAGRWCLAVDVDELFDYPHSSRVALPGLLDYLTRHRYTALVAQLLDLFPEGPLLDAAGARDAELRERHRFYDLADARDSAYRFRGNEVPSAAVRSWRGGVRARAFGLDRVNLTKHPLLFVDGRLRPLAPGYHGVERARVADVTGVLYHYKFVGDFPARVARAVRERSYYRDSREYRAYAAALERDEKLALVAPTSRELRGSEELLACGFLVAAEAYRRFAEGDRSPT